MSSDFGLKQNQSLPFPAIFERVRHALSPDIPVYLVGGAIRDALLGRKIHDLDFTVAGNAIIIARRVAKTLDAAFYVMHDEYETARVLYNGDENIVYTLDFSRIRGNNLESDLQARDFTINAMAVDLQQTDHIIDPLGGISDLTKKIIRACSDLVFCDDPVRILRAVRQATGFGFHIQNETSSLIHQSIFRLEEVSPERLRDEFFRILAGPHPAAALRVLDTLGIISQLCPELLLLKGVIQLPPHISDVWQHTFDVLAKLEALLNVFNPEYISDPDVGYSHNLATGLAVLRLGRYRQNIYDYLQLTKESDRSLKPVLFLAALYHDAGKPSTCVEDNTGRRRFFNHETVSSQIACQRGHTFHLSNHEIFRLQKIIRYHMRPLLLSQTGQIPSRKAIYRFFRDSGVFGIDICLLSLADYMATYGYTLRQDGWTQLLDVVRVLMEAWWEDHDSIIAPPPLINGHDLIKTFSLSPSSQIGELLAAIREAQATGAITNRTEAFEYVNQILKSS